MTGAIKKTPRPELTVKSQLPPTRILRQAARSAWPDLTLRTFRADNAGWTNLMLEADGWLMFRFPRWPESAHSMGTEVRLLEYLGHHISVRVPDPLRIGTLGEPRGWPFMAYRRIPGRPIVNLPGLPSRDKARLTGFLLRLFSELAGLPNAPLRRIGLLSGDHRTWATRFERLQRRYRRTGSGHLSNELNRELARTFADFFAILENSRYRPVLLHNDLWPSHILWDAPTHQPTGVIDWEDARFGDPAFDLATFRDLGAGLDRKLIALRRAPGDQTFDQRLLFYRRILPLSGLLFGLETSRPSIARSHSIRLGASLALESLSAP